MSEKKPSQIVAPLVIGLIALAGAGWFSSVWLVTGDEVLVQGTVVDTVRVVRGNPLRGPVVEYEDPNTGETRVIQPSSAEQGGPKVGDQADVVISGDGRAQIRGSLLPVVLALFFGFVFTGIGLSGVRGR